MSEQHSSPSSAGLAGTGTGATPGRHRVSLAEIEPPVALGPLDGRYRQVVAPLVDHLSEAALNRARLDVEVSWLVHLTTTGALPGAPALREADVAYLRGIVDSFGAAEIAELAEIERETRHDVKAVEYFLKRRLAAGRRRWARTAHCPGRARSSPSSAPARTSTTSPTR